MGSTNELYMCTQLMVPGIFEYQQSSSENYAILIQTASVEIENCESVTFMIKAIWLTTNQLRIKLIIRR